MGIPRLIPDDLVSVKTRNYSRQPRRIIELSYNHLEREPFACFQYQSNVVAQAWRLISDCCGVASNENTFRKMSPAWLTGWTDVTMKLVPVLPHPRYSCRESCVQTVCCTNETAGCRAAILNYVGSRGALGACWFKVSNPPRIFV